MNKFFILTVVALASVALANGASFDEEFPGEAQTQSAFASMDNDAETNAVANAGMGIFADFCINARDTVFGDLKQRAGSTSSKGFSFFFSIIDEIAKESLNAGQSATERLSNQLANPDAEVEGDDAAAEAARQMGGQSQLRALATAFAGTMKTTANTLVDVVSRKYNEVKSYADPSKFKEIAANGCSRVDAYEKQLREMFAEYKQNLPAEAKQQFARATFDTVPCITASRISQVNGLCRFVQVAHEPLKRVINYRPKN